MLAQPNAPAPRVPVSLGDRVAWAGKAAAPASLAGLLWGTTLGFLSGGIVFSPLTAAIGGYAGAAAFGAIGAVAGFRDAEELEALERKTEG